MFDGVEVCKAEVVAAILRVLVTSALDDERKEGLVIFDDPGLARWRLSLPKVCGSAPAAENC